jgi:hypothetical protein
VQIIPAVGWKAHFIIASEKRASRDKESNKFQVSGNSFVKMDLPFNQPPGKESDPEMVGAVMAFDFVTPTRWENSNTLILEKHDYYEKLTPSSGKHGFARLYEIMVSFKEEGRRLRRGRFAATGKLYPICFSERHSAAGKPVTST